MLSSHVNPCITLYGAGPAGERCGSCLRLRATRIPCVQAGELREQTIYYCGLSAGARRVTAPACAQYVPAALPEELHEEPSEAQPGGLW
jgi:hypothetical protein